MALGGLEIRPVRAQGVERRQRLGWLLAAELGLRLGQRVGRIVALRQLQDVIVVALRLLVTPDRLALRGQRRTVGDGVGRRQLVGQFAIPLLRIEPVGDPLACLRGPGPPYHSGISSTTM